MNRHNETRTRLHNRLDELTQDGGGAQAEPWVSVRRAHPRQRNLRTGTGLVRLTSPAQEDEVSPTARTPRRISSRSTPPEADDTSDEDRGSGERSTLNQPESSEEEEVSNGSDSEETEPESDPDTSYSEDETTPRDRPNPANRRERTQTGPKPGIKIASLNMRGRIATMDDLKGKEKIEPIMRWMTHNNIAILTLLDTHWDVEYEERVRNKHHGRRILCEHESSLRGGIAFIIDEKKEAIENATIETIIPGRSALLTVKTKDQTVKIVAIYVPPDKIEKKKAIKTLRKMLEQREDKNEIIITGDWNMVEDERDRSPPKRDRGSVTKTIRRLKTTLNLVDGWRECHEDDIDFTWEGKHSEDHIFARIDRIYAPSKIMGRTNEWEIIRVEKTISDHHAVSMKILDPDPPYIGRGEWRMNLTSMEHPHFHREATILIENLQKDLQKYDELIERNPNNERRTRAIRKTKNPQLSWAKYKTGIRRAAREVETIEKKNIRKERTHLERVARGLRARLARCAEEGIQKDLRREISDAEKALSEMTARRRRKANDTIAAKWFKADERATKLWYSQNKEWMQKQVIHSLYKAKTTPQDDLEETRNTDEMLKVAHDHHAHLQMEQPMTAEREYAIEQIVQKIKGKKGEINVEELEEEITDEEVLKTITGAKTGKAPGCDGIPNEFWKQEVEWQKAAREKGEHRPNIAKLLTRFLRDIEEYGPINESFAEGRMSLLYKKKDKREIANYRPITLLNTDYKLYTTILTKRIGTVAPQIINTDQAGFMPNRSIYNQTKLIELVIKLCENKNRNGIALALDQEKAYDRIDHAYLWKIMETYGIPERFIIKVKRIYEAAYTAIRINGCISPTFAVKRGVRQGDPMSCLLYNIAIEPLFDMIRDSEIKGISIHENTPNARLCAYADDTTAFLSETDDPKTLMEIIDIFCVASTAKFNTGKTEIIPMGTPTFRKQVEESRTFNGWKIPNEVRIARDNEAIRILGSWQGNNVSVISKWEEIIENQTRIMKLWSRSFPSIIARVRVAKALVISRAFYLMTVNGISKAHMDIMEKLTRRFIWGGKKGTIAWNRATQPREEGGLGAPNIKLIYEAIKILWLKRWLNPTADRPKWAWAANAIIEGDAQTKPPIPQKAITEWILQTWHEKGRSERIPQSLREILKTARKYNLKISVTQAPQKLKLDMPAFFHPGAKNKRLNNTKGARCLQENHGVKQVRDLVKIRDKNHSENENCTSVDTCSLLAEKAINNLYEIWNPKYDNEAAQVPQENEREGWLFNQTSGDGESPLENIRIFGERRGYLYRNKTSETPKNPLRTRKLRRGERNHEPKTVHIGSSVENAGWENSKSGICIWYGERDKRNIVTQAEGGAQTKQQAELTAILIALRTNPNTDITIITETRGSIEAIGAKVKQWEDRGWHKVKNANIMMNILHELRTRPNQCRFIWANNDPENVAREEALKAAQKLAKEAIKGAETAQIPIRNQENSRAIHDGARLSTLKMKDIYSILTEANKEKGSPALIESLDEVKREIEETTGLRPTTENLIAGIWKMDAPTRAKDHMWNMIMKRTKCGSFWKNITGYADRAFCEACRRAGVQDVIEDEEHLWTKCENNGQEGTWKEAKRIWEKTTTIGWPTISIELIRGVGGLTIPKNETEPRHIEASRRIRTIIVMAVWAIWKTRNKRTIQGTYTPPEEAARLLNNILTEYIKQQWSSFKFTAKTTQKDQYNYMRGLWGNDIVAELMDGQRPQL